MHPQVIQRAASSFHVGEMKIMSWITKAIQSPDGVVILITSIGKVSKIEIFQKPHKPEAIQLEAQQIQEIILEEINRSKAIILLINMVSNEIFSNSDSLSKEFSKANITFRNIKDKDLLKFTVETIYYDYINHEMKKKPTDKCIIC
jgi:hypothetical protein